MSRLAILILRLSRTGLAGVTPAVGVLAILSVEDADRQMIPAAVLAVICFHYFGVVSNDIFDIDVDRLTPRRGNSPLVRGEVGVGLAWTVVAIAFSGMVGIGIIFGHTLQLVTAAGLMALYNALGKRVRLPLLMDLVQGAAWTVFYFFLVSLLGSHIDLPGSSVVVGIATGLFFTIMNAAHGGVRDVVQDMEAGRVTTAILLGVRCRGGRVVWTNQFRAAIWSIEMPLMILTFSSSLVFGSDGWLLAIDLLTIMLTIALTYSLFRTERDVSEILIVGNAHMLLCLYLAVLTALPQLSLAARLAALGIPALFVAPMMTARNLREGGAGRLVLKAMCLRW